MRGLPGIRGRWFYRPIGGTERAGRPSGRADFEYDDLVYAGKLAPGFDNKLLLELRAQQALVGRFNKTKIWNFSDITAGSRFTKRCGWLVSYPVVIGLLHL